MGPRGLRAIAERVAGSDGDPGAGPSATGRHRHTQAIFRHPSGRGNGDRNRELAEGRRGAAHEFSPHRRPGDRNFPGRNHVARGCRGDLVGVCARRRPRRCAWVVRRRGVARRRAGLAGGARPQERIPDASRVQHPPLRDRDAPLHQEAGGARSVADAFDDPARLVHDEAERHRRDASHHLARVEPHPPVRARGAGRRLPPGFQAARSDAGRDHGLRRDLAATERGLAGRIRRPVGDSQVSSDPRPGTARRLSDPVVRARDQPSVGGAGRLSASSSSPATMPATSISAIWRPRRANIGIAWRR